MLSFRRPARRGAHPRSRGEHGPAVGLSDRAEGSSPLARGTHDFKCSGRLALGLIPARAGNTGALSADQTGNGAHPRSRGEHAIAALEDCPEEGSSPLARGTRRHSACRLPAAGLIPARAGNTPLDGCWFATEWAHPRSRGEHWRWTPVMWRLWGSSPLARGTHGEEGHQTVGGGLIPARAGNTAKEQRQSAAKGAHPRSRGEHAKVSGLWFRKSGSSPLARGTLCHGESQVRGAGLIPARAGNTLVLA